MDTEYCARKDDLIRFGKDLDASLDDEMAYKKGVENFNINFDDLIKILKNHPECKDNVLILMPNRSTDGASAVGNPTSPSVDLCDLCEYRRELQGLSANRVILYDDKILIFYNTDDNHPTVIKRKDTEEFISQLNDIASNGKTATNDCLNATGNNSPSVQNENSLEPQKFKRVSLGGEDRI